jgi:hypothetical protein
MKEEFVMTDLGKLTYFLDIGLVETEKGLVMHQQKYVKDVLRRFKMADHNQTTTPVQVRLVWGYLQGTADICLI